MKKYQIIIILLLLVCENVFAQDIPIDSPYNPTYDSMKVYTDVQVKPKFYESLNKYIADSIKYPQEAKEKNIQGTVFTQCIIERNGLLTFINILRSPDTCLNSEAKRVVSTMPNWIPGEQNGKPVRVTIVIPVHFKLPPSTDSTMKK